MVRRAGRRDARINGFQAAAENPVDMARRLKAFLLAERIDDVGLGQEPYHFRVVGVAVQIAEQYGRLREREKKVGHGAKLVAALLVVAPIDVRDDDVQRRTVGRGPARA